MIVIETVPARVVGCSATLWYTLKPALPSSFFDIPHSEWKNEESNLNEYCHDFRTAPWAKPEGRHRPFTVRLEEGWLCFLSAPGVHQGRPYLMLGEACSRESGADLTHTQRDGPWIRWPPGVWRRYQVRDRVLSGTSTAGQLSVMSQRQAFQTPDIHFYVKLGLKWTFTWGFKKLCI